MNEKDANHPILRQMTKQNLVVHPIIQINMKYQQKTNIWLDLVSIGV